MDGAEKGLYAGKNVKKVMKKIAKKRQKTGKKGVKMRKKVKEFAVAMTAETTLDEIWSVCKTPEEIRYVLGQGERLLESAPRKNFRLACV